MPTALRTPSSRASLRPPAASRGSSRGGRRGALAVCLSLAACVDTPDDLCGDHEPGSGDLGAPAPARRSVALSADPNGLWWDPAGSTLYIADDDGNRILKWTDADGVRPFVALPAAPAEGPGLGQPVVTAAGTLVVPRFGFGTAGDVVSVTKEGRAEVVPGLATERRRIGLTVAQDGALYGSYFVKAGAGRVGAVAKLTLQGMETEVLTGLQKPVGVLALGADLYVSDQDLGQILKAPLAMPAMASVFAKLPAPDLLAAGPSGSIFTGGLQGGIRQISATGEVTVLQKGLKQPRGLAWDPVASRLFIANQDNEPADGVAHTLEILSLAEPVPSPPASCP